MLKNNSVLSCLIGLLSPLVISAHDTWVEVNANKVDAGQYAYVNLMLGNHGNDHRDFKLASKITLEPCQLFVIAPDKQRVDLKPRLIDMGYAPKEGYWTAKFDLQQSGLYRIVHTLDTLHLTTRALKSSKTFVFAVGDEAGASQWDAQDECYGFGLELVLETSCQQLSTGFPIVIRVMRNGVPLASARVTIVPRGVALAEGFDPAYERMSDEQGRVRFVPQEGNVYLAVVHHPAPEEKGDGYDKTHYSATMVLNVAN